jgi:hypothetical protein
MTNDPDAYVPIREDAPPDVEERSRRLSRWVSILYVAAALGAPLLLYFGPDVLSPTAPAIADAALDGHFTMHATASCTTQAPARANAGSRC